MLPFTADGDVGARALVCGDGGAGAPRLLRAARAVVGVLSSANRRSLCASRVLPVRPAQVKFIPAASPGPTQYAGPRVRAIR